MIKLFMFAVLLGVVYCKPVKDAILPHSRDYYAGYIKAITDNFEQLFAADRPVRSTGEDDDEKGDPTAAKLEESSEQAQRRSVGPESLKDIKHYDAAEAEQIEKDEAKRSDVNAEKAKKTSEKTKKAKVKTAEKEQPEKREETETEKKSEEPTKETEVAEDDKEKEKSSEESDVPNVETAKISEKIEASNTETSETDDKEESESEKASEIEPEQSIEFRSDTPESSEMSEEALRRQYILEHAATNRPIFPGEIRGYQDNINDMPYNTPLGMANIGASYQGGNAAFVVAPPSQYIMESGTPTQLGWVRSDIHKRFENAEADVDNIGQNGGTSDSHHLHRILVLPNCRCGCDCGHHTGHHACDCGHHTGHHACDCGHHTGHHACDCSHHVCDCGHHGHDCGHHGCGNGCHAHVDCGVHDGNCHELVHDIHHPPAGHPEYYSHESPCLTYPHANNVGFGYVNNHGGCGHHTSHGHHAIVLHPTYQETHHHNISPVVMDCHGNCVQHDAHHHDCGHHNTYHHGHDHDIAILPHYGHTCAGITGWNPYWGH